MKTQLFLSLSAGALLGVSSVAYGGWMWYNLDSNNKPVSRPVEGKGPESDCLEMICEHGCVEKDNDSGYCCPSDGEIGDSCKVNGEDVGVCCQSGRCEDGECKSSSCTFNKKTYDDGSSVPDANGCGVCHNGVVKPKEEEDCRTCNMTNWRWQNVTNYTKKNDDDGTCCVNGKRQNHASQCPAPCDLDGVKYESGKLIGQCGKCQNGRLVTDFSKLDGCHECNTEWQIVEKASAEKRICGEQCCDEGMECIDGKCSFVTEACVPLYTNKVYKKTVKGSPCCGQLVPKGDSGVLFKGFHEADASEYGCCPNEMTYIDSAGNKRCCSGLIRDKQCVDVCIENCNVGKKCILLSSGTYDLSAKTHRGKHGYCGWITMAVTPPGEKTQDLTAYGATNPKGGHVYDSGTSATLNLPKDTVIEVTAQTSGVKYCSYSCSVKKAK